MTTISDGDERKPPGWPATRYRRRTHIPLTIGEQQIGWLTWLADEGRMEAFTADGTSIGKYPTRREATSALWRTEYAKAIRRASRQASRQHANAETEATDTDTEMAPSGLSGT
jgi:hypothetical protein